MSLKLLYYCTIFCSLLIITACSHYIPKKHIIENSDNYIAYEENQLNSDQQCRYNKNSTAINATSIKIVSWNNLAGCRQPLKKLAAFTHCDRVQADHSFTELTRNRDLILIQEAYLDHDTLQLLKNLGENYSWDMAVSFIADSKLDIPTGVLTAANAKSLTACPLRTHEPIFPTPKAILFTTYNLTQNSNTILEKKLLIVNIHAVLIGKDYFYQQLNSMADKIATHYGPVILAGDFNTMTAKSYSRLKYITDRLEMLEVTISSDADKRSQSLMGQQYDFIFYKDLVPVKAGSIDLKETKNGKTSDHNPVFAEFKLLAE